MGRHPSLVATLALVAGVCLAQTVGEGEVGLRFISTPQGSRVVLEFTSRPNYQVRQEAGLVVVTLHGSYRSIPYKQKMLDDPVMDRFKLNRGFRQTELLFTTGPEFASVGSFEMTAPFRLVLDFNRRSAVSPGAPPGAGHPTPGTTAPPESKPPAEPAPAPPPPGEPIPVTPRQAGVQVIVVDAGHGGSETGARGPGGLLEKEITLDVARRLKNHLEKRLGVTVILTREADRQVGLDERTAIANHNQADLFLSIHANASPAAKARGAETYFLSYQASDDASRTLAALENNALGVETPPGDGKLEMVLWGLAQAQYLSESSALAEVIQQNLNDLLRIESRGVRQAPFRVLMGATMPAVLVEIGFITNSEEEVRLKDPGYRDRIALALAESVATFKERTEKRLGLR